MERPTDGRPDRLSITTIHRVWAEAGLKPHRTETFNQRPWKERTGRLEHPPGSRLRPLLRLPFDQLRAGTHKLQKWMPDGIAARGMTDFTSRSTPPGFSRAAMPAGPSSTN